MSPWKQVPVKLPPQKTLYALKDILNSYRNHATAYFNVFHKVKFILDQLKT